MDDDLYNFQNLTDIHDDYQQLNDYGLLLQPSPSSRRMGTGYTWNQMGDEILQRPMTSVHAVGYSSEEQKGELSEKLHLKGSAPPLQKKSEIGPEEEALELEKEIHKLLEESALYMVQKKNILALEKAKEAERKDYLLKKFRKEQNLQESNIDLTCSVQFNVARQYHANGMYTEALDTYTSIVKNKQFQHGARLRVNMGNLYFEQLKYPLAIKMYRMASDKIQPVHGKELKYKIMKNIGIAFIKMRQYKDAVHNFEQIADNINTDIQSAYNLLICYYALGDSKKMKKAFGKLLRCKIPGMEKDEMKDDYHTIQDDLYKYLREKERKHWNYILRGARLIAEVVENTWEEGYNYIIEELKSFARRKDKSCTLVSEMEMAKALAYLQHEKFQKAIEELKSFEKKDNQFQSRASTNLSYLYFLEGDLKNAEKYADIALEADKYNAKALVNKGNVSFVKKNYEKAKEYYIEALNVEADCVQAIYNLGLANLKLKEYDEAILQFKRLLSIIPENVDVMYQIAKCYQEMKDYQKAIEWYNRLITRVPTDARIWYTLGQLYAYENDKSQAYLSHLESYRYFPSNMDVISWLGAYFVEHGIYEEAMQYFERAMEIEPNKVDWELMVASCYRRIGAYQQAKKCYKNIHSKYPEDVECLKYLVQICTDLGLHKEAYHYSKQLQNLEQKLNKNESNTRRKKIEETVEEVIKLFKVRDIDVNEWNAREVLMKFFESQGIIESVKAANENKEEMNVSHGRDSQNRDEEDLMNQSIHDDDKNEDDELMNLSVDELLH